MIATLRAKSLHLLSLIAIGAFLVLLVQCLVKLGFEISVLRKRQFCVFVGNL